MFKLGDKILAAVLSIKKSLAYALAHKISSVILNQKGIFRSKDLQYFSLSSRSTF
jgi:hypothetical protein